LFQVLFAWQNNEEGEWNLPGLQVDRYGARRDSNKFDVELYFHESDDEIRGGIAYSTDLFDRETMERYIGYLQAMLQAMSDDDEGIVSSMDILSVKEREMLLRTWNETAQEYPAHLCLHHLFEQQVERTPEAKAVVFNDQSLTYRELNERANRLAHQLIGLGVQPDTRVAICVDRSIAMIVGVLAVLKSGGAYVPLDPLYPKDRLTDILTDCAPGIVLADAVGRDTFSTVDHPLSQKGRALLTMMFHGNAFMIYYTFANEFIHITLLYIITTQT
jgi:non-ribosomal peptide synthetase component F